MFFPVARRFVERLRDRWSAVAPASSSSRSVARSGDVDTAVGRG